MTGGREKTCPRKKYFRLPDKGFCLTQLRVLLAEDGLPVPDEPLVVAVDGDVRLVVERVQAAEVAVRGALVAEDAEGWKWHKKGKSCIYVNEGHSCYLYILG